MNSRICIAQVAVLSKQPNIYDYFIPVELNEQLLIGARVVVPLRKKEYVGIVTNIGTTSTVPKNKLKEIISVLEETSAFTNEQSKLLDWFHKYYHINIASAFSVALPPAFKQTEVLQASSSKNVLYEQDESAIPVQLNLEQQEVANKVKSCQQFQVFLLYGVTGSGKTEAYIHIIRDIIQAKRQAIVLVPEIGLTPQTLSRFNSQLTARIVMVHSSLSAKKRADIWQAAKQGNIDVIIGTRSAVFFPFKDLGVIVVDESHDSSYKQQDRVRYHARDVAIYRAKINNIPIVLGTATPSLESLYNVQQNKYQQLTLSKRAKSVSNSVFNIVDIRHKQLNEGISAKVLPKIEAALKRGEQILVFINKRGFSPVLMCTDCGETINCDNCDAKLSLHLTPYHLHCHHCLRSVQVPEYCEKCDSPMKPIGYGTERIAEALAAKFKDFAIYRIDRDTITTTKKLDAVFTEVRTGVPCILVGTQMLAKGHDFSNLTLAVIVNIDASFYSQDFRALEKLGQLIVQVSGRVGRHNKPGEICLQTTEPTELHLRLLVEKGYLSFANKLLLEREKMNLPPKSFIARISAEAKKEQGSKEFLTNLKNSFPLNTAVNILGPYPAILLKRKNLFRYHLVLKSASRSQLHISLNSLKTILANKKAFASAQWILEVDPLEV